MNNIMLVALMNEIQTIQRDLLLQFITVCERHKLRYYLFGGTCLGAIRHQGFIPWDDDLDVAMPRPDFNRLLGLKDEFKAPYFLQSVSTDHRYSYPFMKLRNSNTAFFEAVFAPTKMNHGIWIDIFPLDGMSKKIGQRKIFSIRPYWLWFRWYFSYLGNLWHLPRLDHRFFLDVLILIITLPFLPFRFNNWHARFMNKNLQCISYDEATLVGPYLTMYFNKEALPKEVFGDGVLTTFEGLSVKVPADYDKYLRHIYGDYMKLPPKEKQVGHHYHVGVSTTKSYRDYK